MSTLNWLDWSVMLSTILAIVGIGIVRTRGTNTVQGYLRGGNEMKWHTIGLSIMATQASAITFLSVPGQAYDDGMRFVQFYLGLPIAMVILSAVVVPLYYRARVYTAYEYLEQRFDLKTRQLAALFFLMQRGLAAGITIFAPAIILSTLMGWSLNLTNLLIGSLVTLYTVSGGTKAVSQTQKQQMIVMMGGMVVALVLVFRSLPTDVGFGDAVSVAGAFGRMNIIDFSFDTGTRYTFWSGITGGLFLAMAYFGTDQSQVQRYLSGQSITQSRLGLLFNGLLKIPMQFLILFVGIMVFVFYQFEAPPAFFNSAARAQIMDTEYAGEYQELESAHAVNFAMKKEATESYLQAIRGGDDAAAQAAKAQMRVALAEETEIRDSIKAVVKKGVPKAETKDSNYIFLTFVLSYMPHGLIGLLLAVILSAAMSSTAGELNALGTTMTVDYYRRTWRPGKSDEHYVKASKAFTVFWGALAVVFATFASLSDNLIEAVNILGSLFYGATLGIFLVAFFFKSISGTTIFIAGLLGECVVIGIFFFSDITYLWYNPIGSLVVIFFAFLLQPLIGKRRPTAA